MTDEPVFCVNVQRRRKPYAPGTGSYAFFTVGSKKMKKKKPQTLTRLSFI